MKYITLLWVLCLQLSTALGTGLNSTTPGVLGSDTRTVQAKVCVNGKFLQNVHCHLRPDFPVTQRCKGVCPGTHYLRVKVPNAPHIKDLEKAFERIPMELRAPHEQKGAKFSFEKRYGDEDVIQVTAEQYSHIWANVTVNDYACKFPVCIPISQQATMFELWRKGSVFLQTSAEIQSYATRHGVTKVRSVLTTQQLVPEGPKVILDSNMTVEEFQRNFPQAKTLLSVALFPERCNPDLEEEHVSGGGENDTIRAARMTYHQNERLYQELRGQK